MNEARHSEDVAAAELDWSMDCSAELPGGVLVFFLTYGAISLFVFEYVDVLGWESDETIEMHFHLDSIGVHFLICPFDLGNYTRLHDSAASRVEVFFDKYRCKSPKVLGKFKGKEILRK